MSQENVEVIRRLYAAFADGGVEATIPFVTEDAVLYSIPEWPDDSEYHGHDGIRRLTRQWTENFDDFGMDLQELHDAGDAVVALYEMTGQTKGSAIPMQMQIGAVCSGFRDGRIAQQRSSPVGKPPSRPPGRGSRTTHGKRRKQATIEVELAGLEPATSWVRSRRSSN
jgi:ketosteroid isomerase-like protein